MVAGRCPTPAPHVAEAERALAAMEAFLDSAEAEALTHRDLERAVEAHARELEAIFGTVTVTRVGYGAEDGWGCQATGPASTSIQ